MEFNLNKMSMARKTKLKIIQDNYNELEIWRNDVPAVSISLGIIDEPKKRDEIIISLDNNQIDLLIDALIDLRYE